MPSTFARPVSNNLLLDEEEEDGMIPYSFNDPFSNHPEIHLKSRSSMDVPFCYN
jgi:hypothetical protein